MINKAGINQYSTLNFNQTLIQNPQHNEFNYGKLREIQNLDWSEDLVYEALKLEKMAS